MGNIILRPVFNRPEMLALSLEYEYKAREAFNLCDFKTVFLVEHGADDKTKELVSSYKYDAIHIIREEKFGLSKNILEGMKAAFSLADSFVIHLEDDILLHPTYFRYMSKLLKLTKNNYSILSAYSPKDFGKAEHIMKHNHYAALAPVISKHFFKNYIEPNANQAYYDNPSKYVTLLNDTYRSFWGTQYKFTDTAQHEQAGLINRLVDIANILEDLWVYMPTINRQQHIGYFGKNRPGGKIPGESYEERLNNLREIIKNPSIMYELSATKQYNDYMVFSEELDKWTNTLTIQDNYEYSLCFK